MIVETRYIKLYNDSRENDVLVETNAPGTLIDEALEHRDYVLETEEYPLSDFEIIQSFIEEKGFVFSEIEAEEEYYW